jgi:Protein kinase domain
MGEVYRADDLKLGQTVALKLLPDHFVRDPARLAQFHNEVRVARTISHRNVCRTYDIGDADGRPFLTMEYVDGEDLASLLRRIGRFPQDKAVEVARQICAGLAAAHDRGVLHRDLKPANVMIDGEGHVRITDFGLAALAGSVDDVRAGTPAYMAPEQLAGKEVTQRSDIYALGLVLFELFTGKRMFDAKTLNELLALHETGALTTPTSHVRDLEPTVERAILRCLEREPAKRPPSALAVSAALPGGDQLAAALAAGETPSPEMVAAAGEQSALQPAVGVALVAFTLAMLAVLTFVSVRFAVVHRIPLPRSTDSLKDRAQELIERFGFRDAPADTAYGWDLNREYLSYARPKQAAADLWPALASGRTRTATFWYRTSPTMLVPSYSNTSPTEGDPPLVLSDMRRIRVDAHGRLIEFHSMTPQVEPPATNSAPAVADWAALFDAAALPLASFHEVPPQWTPRGFADARRAWEGPLPDVPDAMVRVEAAAYRGRPVFFSVLPPWTAPALMVKPAAQSIGQLLRAISVVIAFALLAVTALLARRHLRTGRGDRRGAFRTAAVMCVSLFAGLLLRSRIFSDLALEYDRLGLMLAISLYGALNIWLFYVALEPYVRRFWPQLLIGWTRLLSGRFRDPLVGRDVLVGVAAGTIAAFLIASRELLPRLLGLAPPSPTLPNATILLGSRHALALALQITRSAAINAMQCVGVVVVLRIVVKRAWLVLVLSTLAILPIAMDGTFAGEQLGIELAITITGICLIFAVLLRFGLLALLVTFYTFLVTGVFPLTLDFSRPYAGASVALLVAVAGLSILGFVASRGGEPLFGRPILD